MLTMSTKPSSGQLLGAQPSKSPWLTSFMATAPAPLKIPGDTNGPLQCISKMSRRKKCSAAWPPWKRNKELCHEHNFLQARWYQSVIPYLHVNGAAKLIAFMKDVFDAK